jgi:MtN3 and saliva related transmembrane protein
MTFLETKRHQLPARLSGYYGMTDLTTYIGIGAGLFTGISMLPQLIKIIKEKKAEAISYYMLLILICGLSGWIWYGIRKNDLPILFTNVFSLVINILVVIFSRIYKKRPL